MNGGLVGGPNRVDAHGATARAACPALRVGETPGYRLKSSPPQRSMRGNPAHRVIFDPFRPQPAR